MIATARRPLNRRVTLQHRTMRCDVGFRAASACHRRDPSPACPQMPPRCDKTLPMHCPLMANRHRSVASNGDAESPIMMLATTIRSDDPAPCTGPAADAKGVCAALRTLHNCGATRRARDDGWGAAP